MKFQNKDFLKIAVEKYTLTIRKRLNLYFSKFQYFIYENVLVAKKMNNFEANNAIGIEWIREIKL